MNQTIFDENLEKFTRLEKIFAETGNTDYIIENALNGEETLKIKNDEGEYIYVHSKYEPSVIAKKQVESRTPVNETIFVIAGVGLGYELQEIINLSKGFHNIIIYEPNVDILKECMSRVDTKEYNSDNLIFCLEHSEFEFCLIEQTNTDIKDPLIHSNFGYEVIYKEEIDSVKMDCGKIVGERNLNDKTAMACADAWTNNVKNNLKYYKKSYPLKNLFGGIYKDKPAIIVAGGPSLDKNVTLLKEVKGKYLILCSHTAYKRLIAEDIVPDFVFAIDFRQPLLEEYMENGFDVPFVTLGNVNHEVMAYANKEIYFIYHNTDGIVTKINEKMDKEIPPVSIAGTVTGTMMSLAIAIECSPVIMIGQDLAYTDNKTHSNGTIFGDKSADDFEQENGRIMVEDQNGGMIKTSNLLNSYKNWFEHQLKYHFFDANVINATEGGANIKGMKNMTLRDVIDTYKTDENIDELYKTVVSKGKMFTDDEIIQMYDYLKVAKKELENLLPTLSESAEITKELEKIYCKNYSVSPKKLNKLLSRYDELQIIVHENTDCLGFLGIYLKNVMIKADMAQNKYSDEEMRSAAKMNAYHNELLVSVKKIIEALDYCIKEFEEA